MSTPEKKILFNKIGPLRPMMFSYDGYDGERRGIVLYGTDYLDTWKQNIDQLPALLYDYDVLTGRVFGG